MREKSEDKDQNGDGALISQKYIKRDASTLDDRGIFKSLLRSQN